MLHCHSFDLRARYHGYFVRFLSVGGAEKIAITLADVFYLNFSNQYTLLFKVFAKKYIGRHIGKQISNNFNYVAIK